MNNNPKKRGRKPKTNIIVNDNPVFKNDKFNDVIVCINKKTDNDDLNNLDITNQTDDLLLENENQCYCCNCTKKLTKNYIELPVKYINNIFYVKDTFCSLECANRYAYDNLSNYNEILSLLYMYYSKISNNKQNIINIANPISMLKHNGGDLSTEKYCSNFVSINYLNYPYTLNSNINMVDNKDINNNKIINLKLCRSNKINKNKNNIFNKMNLDISLN